MLSPHDIEELRVALAAAEAGESVERWRPLFRKLGDIGLTPFERDVAGNVDRRIAKTFGFWNQRRSAEFISSYYDVSPAQGLKIATGDIVTDAVNEAKKKFQKMKDDGAAAERWRTVLKFHP